MTCFSEPPKPLTWISGLHKRRLYANFRAWGSPLSVEGRYRRLGLPLAGDEDPRRIGNYTCDAIIVVYDRLRIVLLG